MTRWEYKVLVHDQMALDARWKEEGEHPPRPSLTNVLNRWGAEGWELTGACNLDADAGLYHVFFKRPVEGGPQA